ncbi:MAG: hypothetical protein KM296_00480 [Brockia lithotrophica]|nr:hypothetical protein [Brockia lithotrophica]
MAVKVPPATEVRNYFPQETHDLFSLIWNAYVRFDSFEFRKEVRDFIHVLKNRIDAKTVNPDRAYTFLRGSFILIALILGEEAKEIFKSEAEKASIKLEDVLTKKLCFSLRSKLCFSLRSKKKHNVELDFDAYKNKISERVFEKIDDITDNYFEKIKSTLPKKTDKNISRFQSLIKSYFEQTEKIREEYPEVFFYVQKKRVEVLVYILPYMIGYEYDPNLLLDIFYKKE